MNKFWRRRLEALPIAQLEKFRSDLDALITELHHQEPRDIDIATAHSGDPALIVKSKVLKDDGVQRLQVERIRCSHQGCARCPHGDFFFRYRKRKDGSWSVKFAGQAAFSMDAIEQLSKGIPKQPFAVLAPTPSSSE